MLQKTIRSPPYCLPTVTLSLDDIYLTRVDQIALAATHPNNPLLQSRGQPSTHDLVLGEKVFSSLQENRLTAIPRYDKSAFAGQGDRVSEERWEVVNREAEEKIKVVIFEGWCVGFRGVGEAALKERWVSAVSQKNQGNYTGRLAYVGLQDIKQVNEALKRYDVLTE